MTREQYEASEENYYDGILPPNQADRMISAAEEGQVLKPVREQPVGELIEDVRWPVGKPKRSRTW